MTTLLEQLQYKLDQISTKYDYVELCFTSDTESVIEAIEDDSLTTDQLSIITEFALKSYNKELLDFTLGKGGKIKNENMLDDIIEKKDQPRLLEVLEKHNIDLKQRGNMLILRAGSGKRMKNLTYLLEPHEKDSPEIQMALKITLQTYHNELVEIFKKDDKEKSKKIDKLSPLITKVLEKMSDETYQNELKNIRTEEIRKFIMRFRLEQDLNLNESPKPKHKI